MSFARSTDRAMEMTCEVRGLRMFFFCFVLLRSVANTGETNTAETAATGPLRWEELHLAEPKTKSIGTESRKRPLENTQ